MNIQARRISGSSFNEEDKLRIIFDSDNQPMESVVYTIELVSGPNVTHGGGGEPGEYLHYKSSERDADGDGVIDYSDVDMTVIQSEKGTSVIKVVCESITKEYAASFYSGVAITAEKAKKTISSGGEFEDPINVIEPTILKTGNITLEWSEDNFV